MGEFMGTLVLILLGDGVVANVLLKKSKGENSGWIVITTAWGMAVVAGICTAVACGSPAAHINPAVTLASALLSGNWSTVGPFWAAQFLGAFVGATLVWLVYLPHSEKTPDKGCEARGVLQHSGNSEFSLELAERNHCDNLPGRRWLQFRQQVAGAHRPRSRIQPVVLGSAGLGNRFKSGRPDRLCNQSSARLRSAHCARHPSY